MAALGAHAKTTGECISCGRCADACPMANVNMIAIPKTSERSGTTNANQAASAKPRPVMKTRQTWHLLRGSEVGYVILKAILLQLVCWLVSAARYLPSFVELFGFNPLQL